MHSSRLLTLIAIAVLCLPASGWSQDAESEPEPKRHPLLDDTWNVGLGAFVFDKNIEFRVNGQDLGDSIDFDEKWAIGSDETSFSGVFRWRFGKKWSLWGQYFNSDDSATAVLDEDVKWGDVTFREGSSIGAGVELTVARLFAGRIFSEGPRHEFGLGLGLHYLELGAYLEGEIKIDDLTTGFHRGDVGADSPLPNIGGWYGYAFSDKWLGTARLDWLYVSINEYEGGLYNAALGVQYQAFKHFGFNLSYQAFGLNLDVDKDSWRGSVDLSYMGPYFSVTANW